MSRKRWDGVNKEGRAHSRERWRQEHARADLDRAAREEPEEAVTGEDEPLAIGDGPVLKQVPGPAPLGGVLGEMVRARGWDHRLRGARLDSAWPQIVGAQLAERSRPGRLEGGVLQVVVGEPRWATQLQYMTEQIAGRVAAETGIAVTQVRVVVGSLDD